MSARYRQSYLIFFIVMAQSVFYTFIAEIANIIYDKVVPRDEIIESVCEQFRIREEWLRTDEGDMVIEDTQRDKLSAFFADVLATAPDERSAFVAALADLPDAFWPLVAELARKYADNLKK